MSTVYEMSSRYEKERIVGVSQILLFVVIDVPFYLFKSLRLMKRIK